MKRVFILSSHPLFGKCIETLLGREERVQMVGLTKDVNLAIEMIRALQPDVVIVDSNDSDENRAKVMVQVMKEGLKTQVFGLNLKDNKVLVCHGEQKMIEGLDDFVGMITSKNIVPKSATPPRSKDDPDVRSKGRRRSS